jgi:hypothetical protein
MKFLLACLLTISACGTVQAQPAFDPIEAGRRVRVSILVPAGVDSTDFHSLDRKAGSLLGYDATSIRIDDGPPAIPWAAVSKLEYSAGRHGHAGKGALYGALIGLVAGVVTGITIGRAENGGEGNENLETEGGVALGLGGLLVGAGLGAIVGGVSKTDDWRDVPLAKHKANP